MLVSFLLASSLSLSDGDAFHEEFAVEEFHVLALVKVSDFQLEAIFLAPFQQFAFEVHLFLCHGVKVNVASDDAVADEPMAVAVASVQIDGSDECFKGVSPDVCVRHSGSLGDVNQFFESHLRSESVERFALHDFGSGGGEESFSFVFEMTEKDVRHHSFEDGVAKIFQPFVVDGFVRL